MIKTIETQFPVVQLTNRVLPSLASSYAKEKKKKKKEEEERKCNNCVIWRISSSSKKKKSSLIGLKLLSSRSTTTTTTMPISRTTDAAAASLILTSGASGRINALFSVRALRTLAVLISTLLMLLLVPFRGRKRPNSFATTAAAEKPPPSKYDNNNNNNNNNNDERERERKGGAVVRVPATVPWRSAAAEAVAADHEAAARRAMAIRRVVEDEDERSVRQFELFVSARGDTMFTQSWTPPPPVSIKMRGLVVLLHGLNEHSGRYNDFARQLNAYGYKVYAMDWIGHGGSDGLHAYVHSLDDAVADMISYLDKVLVENPGLPCFCFGHSTGAAIILKAVLDPKVETRVAGVVLTSPAVGVQPAHPIFVVLAPIVSFLLPKYQFSAANKKGMVVSRDPEALVAKYSDPLVFTGSIRLRTGNEILRITSYLQQNMKRLRVPFLILHGTADTVTDPEASKKLYEESSSADKTIKLYEGLLHDLLFEPEREEIVQDIIEWLDCRVNILAVQ